jgi:hypothetical protein
VLAVPDVARSYADLAAGLSACLLKLGLSDPNIPVGTVELDEPDRPPEPIQPSPGVRLAEPPRPVKAPYREKLRLRRLPWALLAMASGAVLLVVLTVFVVLQLHPRPEAPVLHMTLIPAVEPEEFAVSPDGRRIAFTAAGDDGKTSLWIRAGCHREQPCGDRGCGASVLVPDSRHVGFFSQRAQEIDTPAAVQTLGGARTSDLPGAAWNSDHMILRESFRIVEPCFGKWRCRSRPDSTGLGVHRWPCWRQPGISFSGTSGAERSLCEF